MRMPKLDARLQAVAALFTPCDTGADIGADHGRLSCYLLAQNTCKRMIVTDISADSLSKAQQLLSRHGLENRAVFCVGDGFSPLPQTVECAVICGMGGRTMAGILNRAEGKLHKADLVLSSQTEIPLVRKTIQDIGYYVAAEKIAYDAGRYYIVMLAKHGHVQYQEKEIYLGPVLMKEKPEAWREYLNWRLGVVSQEQGHRKQLEWIREELECF